VWDAPLHALHHRAEKRESRTRSNRTIGTQLAVPLKGTKRRLAPVCSPLLKRVRTTGVFAFHWVVSLHEGTRVGCCCC